MLATAVLIAGTLLVFRPRPRLQEPHARSSDREPHARVPDWAMRHNSTGIVTWRRKRLLAGAVLAAVATGAIFSARDAAPAAALVADRSPGACSSRGVVCAARHLPRKETPK